jgi:hypothetical protein
MKTTGKIIWQVLFSKQPIILSSLIDKGYPIFTVFFMITLTYDVIFTMINNKILSLFKHIRIDLFQIIIIKLNQAANDITLL